MSNLKILTVCVAVCQVLFTGIALGQGPVVVLVSPAQNELNVAPNTDLTVLFSEDIDQSTIDSTTFIASGEFTGVHSGVYSYDPGLFTATLDPYSDFVAGEQVTVVLTSGIESLNSDPLDDYMWSSTIVTAAGPGVFAPASSYISPGGYSWSVVAIDVDGDHDLDLATPGYGAARLYVLINNGEGDFVRDKYLMPQLCNLIAAGELNGDDATDIVISSFEQSLVATFLNNGDGTFAPYMSDTLPNAPREIAIADFDLDGHNDLLAVYPLIDSVTIHFGVGDGSFAGTQSFAVNNPYAVAAADLDNDGGIDIAVTSVETDSIVVILTGEIAPPDFARSAGYQAGEAPAAIVAADLNGDHLLDLAAADSGSHDISVLLNDPDNPGTFLEPSFYDAIDPISLDAADIDGDADMDIVVANFGDVAGGVAQLLWNDGDGVFVSTTEAVVGNRQQDVVGADLDGDSDVDLAFARNPFTELVSVALNKKWLFVNPIEHSAIAVEGASGPPIERHIALTANDRDVQFNAVDDADWLTIAPASGIVPADITIYLNTEGLAEGDYSGSIQISAEAENSPQTVSVHLTVYPPGTVPVDYIRICVDSIAAGTVNAEIPFVIQRLCREPERIMGISNGFTLRAAGDATWEFVEYVHDWTVYYWWNLGGMLFTNGFNGASPDTFLVGGAAMPPGGMPITPEHYMMSLFLNIGPGEGKILIDSAFVFASGIWRWSGLTCGFGGASNRPLFLARDSSDLEHPISIRIFAVCGDVNRSAQTDIDDVVFLIAYLFIGGPAPNPLDAGDVDCSGGIDIDDVVYLVTYIFAGGPCESCD